MIDLKSISFSNSGDINNFFKKYNPGGFIGWFNSLNYKFLKKGKSLNSIQNVNEQSWVKFWNQIPTLYGKPSINLAEFLVLTNIVCVETGSSFSPITERLGSSGHPGLSYAFDKIGSKKSYNNVDLGNILAFDLFNDPDYISAHGNKGLSSLLINTTDTRWQGESFPTGFSGNPNNETSSKGDTNGFIYEADFMKFRGRGFIQSTGRSKYTKIVDFVKSYKGDDENINYYKSKWENVSNRKVLTQSTNKDWDKLFYETNSVIASYAVYQFSKDREDLYYIDVNSDKSISDGSNWAGFRTNGSKQYGEDISKIVNTQLVELSIVPDENDNNSTNDASTNDDTQVQSNESETDNNEYPSDLPKVEGLSNFFKPQIKIDPIEFEMPASDDKKKDVASTIGYQPFVWYLAYQLDSIKSLILSSRGLLPTIKLVFVDNMNIMSDDGFPLDDSKIKVFLNSRTPSLRPIFMEFKIVNFSRNGGTYTIDGICNINKFFLREFESYSDMSSFECLQEFARRSNLGFSSNVVESNDKMNWINPGKRGSEFVKDVVSSSYRSDESFIWCYVDYFYNLNYIDVEESLRIDIKNQVQIKNTGLENINGVTNGKEETNPLWLSNDPSLDQTNQYFDEWKIINNSTSISLQNGYLNKAKFYDINSKNYLIFDIDSITSEGDKTIIMKGSPQDMEFYQNHVRPTYVGKLDTDNMHENYNYSMIQNEQNIKDLQKIGMSIKLKTPNYNLFRYQKVNLTFSASNSTPSASQVNNRLTGDWLIIDIDFTMINNELSQKVTLIRRELGLSNEELSKEVNQQKSQGSQSGSNVDNVDRNENIEPIDTTGDQIEVKEGNELIPFSYDLKFTNAAEIDDFFDQYHTGGFIGWFNKEFSNDPNFTDKVEVRISHGDYDGKIQALKNESGEGLKPKINKSNWDKIWNSAVRLIYNDNRGGSVINGNNTSVSSDNSNLEKKEFNIVEFITLNTMIYYLSGNDFSPNTDNRSLVDLFASNNTLSDNETSYNLFNNESYLSINDNKMFSDILKNTTDVSWKGTSFPVGFSNNTPDKEISKNNNDFITNSDFYKFRQRGLIKFKGRHDYGTMINFINSYSGENSVINEYKDKWSVENIIVNTINKSTNMDWEKLIKESDLIIPSVAIGNVMFDLKKVHIFETEGKNEDKIFKSIENVAKLVESVIENTPTNFVDRFVRMVRNQINFLNSKELIPSPEEGPIPAGRYTLDLIPGTYLDNNKNKIELCQIDGSAVRVDVAQAYLTMRDDAKKDGVKLKINSAFRPPYTAPGESRYGLNTKSESGKLVRASSQEYLYNGYKAKKAGFNLAAEPGNSNHGSGIGLDLNSGGSSSERFKGVNRSIYEWLVKNSWKYGFVRSVKVEEWHFDYLPHLISKNNNPYARIDGTDTNKFYSEWGLDQC